MQIFFIMATYNIFRRQPPSYPRTLTAYPIPVLEGIPGPFSSKWPQSMQKRLLRCPGSLCFAFWCNRRQTVRGGNQPPPLGRRALILWIWIPDGNIYLLVLLLVVFQIPVHLYLAIGLLIHATQISCFLTIISPQRRTVLNSLLQPTFPVCGHRFQTQLVIILYYIARHLLKNILKVTSLKLARLSWSWTPNLFTVIS